MKRIIILLIATIILTACSSSTDETPSPFDIELDQVKEINVNTINQTGVYEVDEEWSMLIDVIMSFRYKSLSVNEAEVICVQSQIEGDFYEISLESDDVLYKFLIFDDRIIANYIEVSSSEEDELKFFVAKHNDIKTLQEELSELDFPTKTIRVEKPVIYLYPEEELDIQVSIKPEDIITTSYPQYDNGWLITAKPNGVLCDEAGKKYAYLFWEGNIELVGGFSDGFVVERDDTISFLESKLDILGLNYVEKNDFITYWLPALEQHEYNKIRFYTEEINELAQLEITPAPQTLIRIYMIFEEAKELDYITPQKLELVKRQGYTVVEWGGAEIH